MTPICLQLGIVMSGLWEMAKVSISIPKRRLIQTYCAICWWRNCRCARNWLIFRNAARRSIPRSAHKARNFQPAGSADHQNAILTCGICRCSEKQYIISAAAAHSVEIWLCFASRPVALVAVTNAIADFVAVFVGEQPQIRLFGLAKAVAATVGGQRIYFARCHHTHHVSALE